MGIGRRSSPLAGMLAVALLSGTPVLAQEDRSIEVAATEVASELATCAAYFLVVAHGASLSPGGSDLSQNYEDLALSALENANLFAELGGMLPAAVEAQAQQSMRGMYAQIENNFANLSIVTNEYSEFCIDLIGSPETKFSEYLLSSIPDEHDRDRLREALDAE